ncbi:MAG: septum formation inhibitor Maf [Clostridia bacterium]|nr:septum formation inhibitor Maf [Clostridia bacterium]
MFGKHIILASQSPRRRGLLFDFGFDFEAVSSGADESGTDGMAPDEAVKTLALRKAKWVKERREEDGSVILAADTLVALNGALLGKPVDEEDAFRMLSALSGTAHEVYTGVAILCGDKEIVHAECTKVYFRPIDEEEIREYIATGEPMDKAGAYGIQEKGGIFVRRIEGDYLNVLGLPLCKTYELLRTL